MKKLLLLSLPLLLAACRPVGPTYVPPQALAPAPAPTPVLEGADERLQALVARALASNPDLQAADARLRQARAQQGIQEAAGGPTLGMGAKATRDRMSEHTGLLSNLPVKNLKTTYSTYQLGFDASWEIDLFGYQRRLAEGAQARTQATEERLRDARLVLVAEVARTYIEARLGRIRLGLAQENLAIQRERVHLAGLRRQAGEAPQAEVEAAEAGAATAQAAVASLETSFRQSLAGLSVLTTLPIAELEPTFQSAVPLMAVPAAPTGGLPSDLLRRRPDVRAAERDMAAACADVGVAQADRFPRFILAGGGGWTSTSTGNLMETASTFWSAGPQLSLPLFNQGRLANRVRANEAAYDAATATYRKSVLGAFADTDLALHRVTLSEQRRLQIQEAEGRQRTLVAMTERQVQAGDASRLTLLEARLALNTQVDQQVQAQAQSLAALVSLQKALGGAWTER